MTRQGTKAPTRAKRAKASINNRSESQVRCGRTFHVSGVLGQVLQEKERHMSMESIRRNRLATAVRITCLLLSCMALSPSWSNATVFWEDELEPGNTGYPVVSGMSYATSPVFSGTHSLKEHFLGNHVQGGSYNERYFGTSTDDLWSRYYMYLDNFKPDSLSGTKIMLQGGEGYYPSFWWLMPFGQTTLTVAVQGIKGGAETYLVYGSNIPQNRWACIETHIKMSSPGVSDGIIEAWIDSNQIIARYDLPMRDATTSGQNSPTAKFNYNRLFVQYGEGDLYYDKLAVGNQRIGCSGELPKSETPAQPVPPPQVSVPQAVPPPQVPVPQAPPSVSSPPPGPTPPPIPSGLFIR